MVQLRIAEILKAKQMTNKELASLLNVTPQYISNICHGKQGASINALEKIAKVLNVPIAALFADSAELMGKQFFCPNCGAIMQINH